MSRAMFAVALILAAAMWCYTGLVLVPWQEVESARTGTPRGNLSDLYPRWLGSREMLLHGRNPYSEEVTREIQRGYWGRELNAANHNDPSDEAAFAYPAYVAVLLAPTVILPFPVVRTIFKVLLFLACVASVPLWARALDLRLSRNTLVVIGVMLLGSWAAVQGIQMQQLSLLVAVLLAAATALVATGWLAAAGILLGLAMIKPQLAVPLVAWFALWSAAGFRTRYKLMAGFLGTMAVLLATMQLLLPGWFALWLQSLPAYLRYNRAVPLVQDLLGVSGGRLLAALLILVCIAVCWRARASFPGSHPFSRAVALVLATTLLTIPKWAPYDQLLLLPAILYFVASSLEAWRYSGSARIVIGVSGGLILAGNVLAFAVMLVWIVSPGGAATLHIMPLLTVPFLPVAALLLLLTASVAARPTSTQRSATPIQPA